MSEKTILVVDDEKSSFETYQKYLSGYSALSLLHAKDGVQARGILTNGSVDLVLLDQIFTKANVSVDHLYYQDGNEFRCYPSGTAATGTDEDEQGLHILGVLRSMGICTPVIFVTNNPDPNIVLKAHKLGCTDYLSKQRLHDGSLIEKVGMALGVTLQSLEQQIGLELGQKFPRVNESERKAMAAILGREASPKRRRKWAFVNAVLSEMPSQTPSLMDLLKAVMKLDQSHDWKCEPVNPEELLRWTLEHWNDLPQCGWEIKSINPVRWRFQSCSEEGGWFLNIVRPAYSKDIQQYFTEPQYVEDCFTGVLAGSDPQWEGGCVAAYLEKGTASIPLNVFAQKHAPLPAERIQYILTELALCVSQVSGGHGMIDVDSILVSEDNTVLVGDAILREITSEEGKRQIEGLTDADPMKRDIQALGVAADALLTGAPGGLETISSSHDFFKFLAACRNGTWNLSFSIPLPPMKARFVHYGPFASPLERRFFYQLKNEVLVKSIPATIYLNVRMRLRDGGIPNDVDVLVVLPGCLLWLDVKGTEIAKNGRAATLGRKLADISVFLLSALGDLPAKPRVQPAFVMEDGVYNQLQAQIKERKNNEQDLHSFITYGMTYSQAISQCSPCGGGVIPQQAVDCLQERMLPAETFAYESLPEFLKFGNITKAEKSTWYDELHTDSYYIRRYSIGDVSDKYAVDKDIDELLGEAMWQTKSAAQVNCPNILLPKLCLLIGRDGREYLLNTQEQERVNGRWLYKVYPRLISEAWGPIELGEALNTLDPLQKLTLCRDYLSAVSHIIANKTLVSSVGRSMLQLYKLRNNVSGVLEVRFGHTNDWLHSTPVNIVKQLALPETEQSLLLRKFEHVQPNELVGAMNGAIEYLNARLRMPAPLPGHVTAPPVHEDEERIHTGQPKPQVQKSEPGNVHSSGNKKLFVGGLDYRVTETMLAEMFSVCGTVMSAMVMTDAFTAQSRGFGFVNMSSPKEAQAAIDALNGYELMGRSLTVKEANPKKKYPRAGGSGRRW